MVFETLVDKICVKAKYWIIRDDLFEEFYGDSVG